MGSGEESTPAKPTKPAATTQELPTTPPYPDWASPMQAYYGAGATPPPFFTSTVASPPPPHPYLWGGQHLMPPYGTPPLPYPAIYPHSGLYAHPPMAAGTATTTTGTEGKPSDPKDKNSTKKSKGSSGNTGLAGGKSGDGGKAASGSGNDGASLSGESGSEASSEASDENTNQQDFSTHGKRSFNQMLADGANAQNNAAYSTAAAEPSFPARGQPAPSLPVSVPGKPVVPVPATNLNIGMDLWNASSAGSVPIKARPAAAGVPPAVVPAPMQPEHMWIPDERELKKQRRKQSNRESARRSRLRKQASINHIQGGKEWDFKKDGDASLEEKCLVIQDTPEKFLCANH
ncbi:G-box-binding factor 1 isoform X2 [Magnolia sinica]|uniref:G-box-binding factor 1 isoform X2 n=1 Tax=Magnolia sinica TaxID=86752 RepID=UPI0026590042|nr:G-box-binding factor 1 isoform X2 [Magnolia sinica]